MSTATSSPLNSAPPPVAPRVVVPPDLYRTLPGLGDLGAVFRRQLVFVVLLTLVYTPFALYSVLSAGKKYESTVVMKYDPNDSLDSDLSPYAATQGDFALALAALTEATKDAEFYRELAHRYYPEEAVDAMRLAWLPQSLRHYLPAAKAATTEALQEERAKMLRQQIALTSDLDLTKAGMVRLTAIDGSADRAQRLATVAGQLLIDQYFAAQTRRAAAVKLTLGNLLQTESVKAMAHKAEAQPAAKAPGGKHVEPRQEIAELHQRQQLVQNRIRELNTRLTSTTERKLNLQNRIADMAQRYGPFHPQIRALQSQLEALASSDPEASLKAELKQLEEQSIGFEGAASALSLPAVPESTEGFDRVYQRLSTKLDRHSLELQNLEAQMNDPAQRVRLALLGTPSLSFDAVSSRGPKVAIAAAVWLLLMVFLTIFRELVATDARDAWRISWRFQIHCLGRFSKRQLRAAPVLEPEQIRSLRTALLARQRTTPEQEQLLAFRGLTHWLHTGASGNVILFAKAAGTPRCSSFLYNLFNVYCGDYAGRCLVVDFDAHDRLSREVHGGDVIDFLTEAKPWKAVCRRANAAHAFDLVPAPQMADERLAGLLHSPRFRALIELAKQTYGTVLLVGLSAEHFVENSSLLEEASDCLIVVEERRTKVAGIERLLHYLPAAKVAGFVQVAI